MAKVEKTKTKKQKPELWVSQSEFGRKLGISPTAVFNAVKRGRITAIKERGKVLIEFNSQRLAFLNTSQMNHSVAAENKIRRKKLKYLKDIEEKIKQNKKVTEKEKKQLEESADLLGNLGLSNMHDVKLRLEIAKAKRAEIELAEAEGKVIDYEKVRNIIRNIAVNLQKSIMAIPARIGPLAAAERDQTKCTLMIGDELRRSLRAMAVAFRKVGEKVGDDVQEIVLKKHN